jgi:hypothetical protein
MRRFFLSLLVALSSIPLISQKVFPVNETGTIEITEVFQTELTKDVLYANAQEWITKSFGDYKKVIQFEDELNGKLILKGYSVVQITIPGTKNLKAENILYTITIECRDNKYRFTLDNIVINGRYISLGSTIDKNPFSPQSHFEQCEKYKMKANPSAKDTLDMDKFELRYYHNQMKEVKKMIAEEMEFYSSEYDKIQRIIESLKVSMTKNDTF